MQRLLIFQGRSKIQRMPIKKSLRLTENLLSFFRIADYQRGTAIMPIQFWAIKMHAPQISERDVRPALDRRERASIAGRPAHQMIQPDRPEWVKPSVLLQNLSISKWPCILVTIINHLNSCAVLLIQMCIQFPHKMRG